MQIIDFGLENKSLIKEFITFPYHLYKDDPIYVPHLYLERKKFFSSVNPLFKDIEAKFFIVKEGSKVLGRITAHISKSHIEYHNEKCGFFGFFECIEDYEVAKELFNNAEKWLKDKGMQKIRGPFNFTTNQECGLLIDSFDTPCIFMTTYNKRYYPDFICSFGFNKAKDLVAFYYNSKGNIPDYLERFSKKFCKKYPKIKILPVNKRYFYKFVKDALYVYNNAWSKNWGFIPMTEEEFFYMAEEMKDILEERLAFLCYHNNTPIGFSLTLPDYNIVLKKIGGYLFPFGIFKFFYYKKKINRARVITLGIIKEYWNRGIDILLYYYTFKNAIELGYPEGEMSWILEDNKPMIKALERMGAYKYKTFRIYEKNII